MEAEQKNMSAYIQGDVLTSIVFFPVVETYEELSDIISRAAWYLAWCQINTIYIPVVSTDLARSAWSVAPGMDETIANQFEILREMVVFVIANSESDLEKCMDSSDIILRWKKDCLPKFVSNSKLEDWKFGKQVWQVDPVAVRMEGSFYIEVGLHLLQNKQSLINENKKRFSRLVEKLGRFKRAYIMATGPSVWRYKLYDYEDSISIVCNSVILDEALMNHVRPKILVFADPIFHFGPSQYAATFREELRQSARIHDFTIIIPFKYFALFTAAMPELRERTVAIHFVKHRPFNFDLSHEFEVKTTANILTLLMTPVAATFSNEIGFIGCDGRPLNQNTYFWGHNAKTQINDKMANIRKIHPAFFDIDYNDYYLDHCNTLESQFEKGEALGKKFISLGFSHIPALNQRIDFGQRERSRKQSNNIKNALLVDPDAKSWAGHYMAYNEKLSTQLESQGIGVHVICRRDLSREILSARSNYLPALTTHYWEVGNRAKNDVYIAKFDHELGKALERLLKGCKVQTLLYMYCGSLSHAKVLAKFLEKYPVLTININLFWLSFTLDQKTANEWKDFINWLDEVAGKGRFVATLPTSELRDEVAALTGCILPVCPHPSTGLSDQDFKTKNSREQEKSSTNALSVLFPSAPRFEKGYTASLECAKELSKFHNVQPIIRHAPTYSTPKDLAALLTDIPVSVEVVEGELSNQQYLDLLYRADISVLPYTPDAFAKRTSGLLIDSIYYGIPCVVARGTWLGNLVEKYGCGEVVEDISPCCLTEAVMKITQDYENYRSRSIDAGLDYFARNSWEVFANYLLGLDDAGIGVIGKSDKARPKLVGPYSRKQGAHWDETVAIAEMFSCFLSGTTMVDVGAHHGSALMPFLNRNWRIFAFEPDEKNRQKLLDRLNVHKNASLVSLDTRCVSNESQKGVSFYRSEQSTGISGLSAFHESHVEAQRVDTITLTEFFEGKPLPSVDFLKIDTEGHDLFVLQGFPWDRAKPVVIECEFEDSKTLPLGYTFHDLARYLVDKGYTVYVSEWHPVIRYGIRHDWNRLLRYPCDLSDEKAWGNLLAFRDPIDEKKLIAAVHKVLKAGAVETVKAAVASARSVDEVVENARHCTDESDLNIRTANRLFRAGDYSTAMRLYLLLYQQRPLKMYSDNALMAANRLGMTWVESVDELL